MMLLHDSVSTVSECSYANYVHNVHGRDCEGCRRENAIYKRGKKTEHRVNAQTQTVETGIACLAALNDNIACGALSSYEWHCCRGAACKKTRQEHSIIHDRVLY